MKYLLAFTLLASFIGLFADCNITMFISLGVFGLSAKLLSKYDEDENV